VGSREALPDDDSAENQPPVWAAGRLVGMSSCICPDAVGGKETHSSPLRFHVGGKNLLLTSAAIPAGKRHGPCPEGYEANPVCDLPCLLGVVSS